MLFRKETTPSFLLFRRLDSAVIPVFRPLNFGTARGRDLRAVVSRQTGLPVGVFRLTNDVRREIYDCQLLEKYGLQLGCTVYLETWDGWNELIPAAVSGFAKQVYYLFSLFINFVLSCFASFPASLHPLLFLSFFLFFLPFFLSLRRGCNKNSMTMSCNRPTHTLPLNRTIA